VLTLLPSQEVLRAIQSYVNSKVDRQAQVEGQILAANIPRNAMGKLDRITLKTQMDEIMLKAK